MLRKVMLITISKIFLNVDWIQCEEKVVAVLGTSLTS